MSAISVSLNGEPVPADDAQALSEQLRRWGYGEDQPLAVAVDGRLVPRDLHARMRLAADSRVDVFSLRQGG